MQVGRRYTFFQTINWTRKSILSFLIFDSFVVGLYYVTQWTWLPIPWQPLSLIGIAVAFYLGFKNNSSYDRLWEARKIWGGIVNASRSFTVMARDFINNDRTERAHPEGELRQLRLRVVHRHVAWLHALALELRKLKAWEHVANNDRAMRTVLGMDYHDDKLDTIKDYLSPEDFAYVMTKGNRSSHLLSQQSADLMKLRRAGLIDHFRHLEMQKMITEFYTLQGKAERIKNFPFPRQYATFNFFFVVLFVFLLPFGMLSVFVNPSQSHLIWFTIPFTVVVSWVFWTMEMIGDYSENPFEGLYNDVPITSMARGIEIDIRQMLDETELPPSIQPTSHLKILV